MSMFHRLSGRNGFEPLKKPKVDDCEKKQDDIGAFGAPQQVKFGPPTEETQLVAENPNNDIMRNDTCN
jgi:hypothetical protein